MRERSEVPTFDPQVPIRAMPDATLVWRTVVAMALALALLCRESTHTGLRVTAWHPPRGPLAIASRVSRVPTGRALHRSSSSTGTSMPRSLCASRDRVRLHSTNGDIPTSPLIEPAVASAAVASAAVASAAASAAPPNNNNNNNAFIPTHRHTRLNETQQDFVIGYLNKHHSHLLVAFAAAFTTLGSDMARANVWSGGSFTLESARLTHIHGHLTDYDKQTNNTDNNNNNNNEWTLTLNVTIQRRGQPLDVQTVQFPVTALPIPERARAYDSPAVSHQVPRCRPTDVTTRHAIDDLMRKLCRLADIVQQARVTGQFMQLALQLGGSGVGVLPENMYLNQVPHNRYVRQWFYDKASTAIHDAVLLASQGTISNRQQIVTLFPETNPSMDSYRIGTILELVRCAAIRLAEQNIRVRICVQQSMGVGIFTGVPKQLSGVARILPAMDWLSDVGEENEGMVGDYVRFGGIGADHVTNQVRNAQGQVTQHADDVFIILAPQSMVGTDTSIIPLLVEMVNAAGDRPVILVNADLVDKVSAAGQQSVRGRQARIDFAQSFETIFHFQNIYVSGTSYFPILGSIAKLHPEEPWIAHQRRDYADNGGEVYVPVLAGERMPDGESILQSFAK